MDAMTQGVSIPFAEAPLPFVPATVDELEIRFGDGTRRRPPQPHAALPDGKGQGANIGPDRVELRLYVSAGSMNSSRAVVALHQIVRAFPPRAFRTLVLDVARDVDAATADRVLFTPTLIMLDREQRATRVLGDLSNVEVLVELLRATGLEPV